MLAQRLGAAEVEEGQGERGVGPAGGLDDDPGEPERPGQQRPRQLDGLHPLEPHLALLAEQHALPQLDLGGLDPEPREAPADPVDQGDQPEEEDQPDQGQQRVRDRLLEGLAPARGLRRADDDLAEPEGRQEVVEQLGRRVAQDCQEHDAAPEQR